MAQAEALTPSLFAQQMLPRAQKVGSIHSVEVLKSSLRATQAALDPQEQGSGSNAKSFATSVWEPASPGTTVDLVVVHGQFKDFLAKTPRGAASPVGSVMAFVINSQTGYVLETYVGNRTPASQLGHAVFEATIPEAAHPARNRAGIAKLSLFRKTSRAKMATWGNKCSQGEGHHCYALAIWEMKGSEQVAGTTSLQYTTSVNVPGWATGDFVTNEEWSGFYNSPVGNQYWTEIGQAAGEYYNCCTLRWFYAYQNHSGYHEAVPSERWAIGFNEYSKYLMKANGNGVWCFDVGPNGEIVVKCVEGFETYSKDLEDGAEIAANTQPGNSGHVLVNWWYENPWYFAHQGLYNELGQVSYNGMCVSTYSPAPSPGNINYGTYGSCP